MQFHLTRKSAILMHLLSLLFCFRSVAQKPISAYVCDIATKRAIPFATVGISGKNIGIITGIDGRFYLNVNSTLTEDDTVVISSVAYHNIKILVRDAIVRDTFFLQQKPTELKEITVHPFLSSATYGRTTKKENLNSGWSGEGRGGEIGIHFNIAHALFKIEKIAFYILSGYDSAWFRLHIRSFRGLPGEDLLSENVVLVVTRQKGLTEHNLSDYNIIIENHEDIYVSLELLKKTNTIVNPAIGRNILVTGLKPGELYYKWYPESGWLHKSAYQLSLLLTVKY